MSALVFQLYGPLVSWGEIAVGEERPSAAHPGRGALLGLLGAALGIDRRDDVGQRELAAAMTFGIEVRTAGLPFWDFHTAQTATRAAIRRAPEGVRNRAELLALDDVKTILSKREYRCDAFCRVVAVSRDSAGPFSAEVLATALAAPKFPLYLGRRSCALGLPLDAKAVQADTFEGALAAAPPRDYARGVLAALRPTQTICYWEADMRTALAPERTFTRRDEPVSRRQWLFTTRREHQRVGPAHAPLAAGKET